MINETELEELASFVGDGSSVLSLYLNTDLTQQPKEQAKLILRNLLESVAATASAQDIAKVERFFDLEFDWQARGVALFSLAAREFWRVYPLAVPVASEAHSGDRLYLKPLTELLGEYDRYGIVLADRESARFLLVQMGQIEEKGEWIGEGVKRHKQGGSAAARYQRREDKHAEQNLKLAAEASVRFCEENLCKGMVLGIAADTLPQFEAALPKAWQKKIVGTIAVDMAAPANEVMDRSVELIREQERKREQRLVTHMITTATKGGGAVIGLADTFYVAHQGRVHTLVVEKDFEADGYLCDKCGYVSAEPITKCPFCGGHPQPIHGAVNRVIQKVIQSGGTVQTVRYTDLAKAGHIGAILRY